jgi:hypothetical protein
MSSNGVLFLSGFCLVLSYLWYLFVVFVGPGVGDILVISM